MISSAINSLIGEGVVKVMKNFFDAFNGVGVEGLAHFGMIIGGCNHL